MDDLGKLKHLVEHWVEHNSGHAESYLEWSKKAELLGKEEISGILRELAEGTIKLNNLLKKASDLLK